MYSTLRTTTRFTPAAACLALILFALPLALQAQQDEIYLETKPDSVWIYANGGEVQVVGERSLGAGNHRVVLGGLPPQLDAKSLQVRGEGPATLVEVSTRTNFLRDTPKPPRMKQLEDSLQVLAHTIADKQRQQQVLATTRQALKANQSVGGAQTGVDLATLRGYITYLNQQEAQLSKQSQRLDREIAELERQRHRIEQELEQWRDQRQQQTAEVVAALNLKRAGRVRLLVRYRVYNLLQWSPSYELHAQAQGGGRLLRKAEVVNKTGQPLQGVALSLYTNSLQVLGAVPEVYPRYLRPQQRPRVVRQQSMESANRKSNLDQNRYDQIAADEAPMEMEDLAQSVVALQTDLNLQYLIPQPVDLPADGKAHTLRIGATTVDQAAIRHRLTPVLNTQALAMVVLPDWRELNLLQGPVQLFLDGSSLGRTTLQPESARDTLRIPLLIDEQVAVERKQMEDFTQNRRLGSKIRVELGWEITVRNNRSVPITYELIDRIPHSADNRIEVTVEEVEPASEWEPQDRQGLLRWTNTLEADGKHTYRIRYKITHDEDIRVNYQP